MIYKNKRFLVTGASGFIGTNLINKLIENEAKVVGITHKKEPQINHEDVVYKKLDLTIPENCKEACKDIDYIFMCAANSSGAAVMETKPLTHLTPNILMNTLMLEAAYEANVKKFIFISSNTVYPVTSNAVSENDYDYSFFSKYEIVGWMKLFSEKMCNMYSNSIKNPMKTLVVRPGNLYGPYDKYNKSESKVIAALIRRFAENQNPIDVWGDGNDIKDFLYIDDFVDGLMLAFEYDGDGDGDISPINIASGKPSTIKEVINCLIEIVQSKDKITVNYDTSKPSMIPVRMISNELAVTKLNFKVKNDLISGLKKTLNWYLIFYDNKDPDKL